MLSAMAETDVSFRYLLRSLPRPILDLAFPDYRIEPVGPFDSSVDRPRQRTSDNLFRVRDPIGEAGVHVEIEREWRTEIPGRLFDYATSAMTGTRLPVWSILVLLRPGGQPPHDPGVYRVRGVGDDAIVFRYHVMPLWQLDARSMRAQLGLEAAPYCVAMRGANEQFVRELADEVHTDRRMSERDRQTTMQLLYIVSAAILGIDTARRIFHVESIIQDPNVQELIREWEGRGAAKGVAKGHVEEARRLLLKVLDARSFPVSSDVRARIDGESDVSQLEAWHDAAVTAPTLGDVFRDG